MRSSLIYVGIPVVLVAGLVTSSVVFGPTKVEKAAPHVGSSIMEPYDVNHAEAKVRRELEIVRVKAEADRIASEKKAAEDKAAEDARLAAEEQARVEAEEAARPVYQAPQEQPRSPVGSPPRVDNPEPAQTVSCPGAIIRDMGAWGATDMSSGQIYISPSTPANLVYSVCLHEQGHQAQVRAFGPGKAHIESILAPYGGQEITADCWAQARGAGWLNYGCSAAGRQGASLF